MNLRELHEPIKEYPMTTSHTIETIKKLLADKEAECAAVRVRYRELRADCAELTDLLETLLADVQQPPAVHDESFTEESITPKAQEPDAGPMSGYPMCVDISGATNHVERVRLLALHTENHEVNVYKAARWLIATGASNAAEDSLVSTLYGKLKKLDYFCKVRPAVYRYVPLEEDETFTRVNGDHLTGKLIQFGTKQSE